MSEANKTVVRKYYELLDKGDVDGMMALFSDDISWTFSGMGVLDKNALGGVIQAMRGAFPDMEHTVDAQSTEGDRVTTPLTFRATHTGQLMEIPATGKSVDVRAINVHRIVNGQMVEAETVLDMMGIMQQIGVVPGPG